MGVFPGFGSWINQNSQQPSTAESKRSEDVETKSVSQKDNSHAPTKKKMKKYYDEVEEKRQDELWQAEEKKYLWHDDPPKVKVTREKGVYHMNIHMTVGFPPASVYGFLTYPKSGVFFDMRKFRQLMENKSIKMLVDDGPTQIMKVKKSVAWDVLGCPIPFPIHLLVAENRKQLATNYKKEKLMFLKVFEGSYKVEPLYVDAARFCKHTSPNSQEEYKKCSGGQGRVASKITMDQFFKPYPPFNLPPFSWYIRGVAIETTTNLLKAVQDTATVLRDG